MRAWSSSGPLASSPAICHTTGSQAWWHCCIQPGTTFNEHKSVAPADSVSRQAVHFCASVHPGVKIHHVPNAYRAGIALISATMVWFVLQVHPLTRSFSRGGRTADSTQAAASSNSSNSSANSSSDMFSAVQPIAVKDLRVGEHCGLRLSG